MLVQCASMTDSMKFFECGFFTRNNFYFYIYKWIAVTQPSYVASSNLYRILDALLSIFCVPEGWNSSESISRWRPKARNYLRFIISEQCENIHALWYQSYEERADIIISDNSKNYWTLLESKLRALSMLRQQRSNTRTSFDRWSSEKHRAYSWREHQQLWQWLNTPSNSTVESRSVQSQLVLTAQRTANVVCVLYPLQKVNSLPARCL